MAAPPPPPRALPRPKPAAPPKLDATKDSSNNKSRQRLLVRGWLLDALKDSVPDPGALADQLEACIFELAHCDQKNRTYRQKASLVKKRLTDPKFKSVKLTLRQDPPPSPRTFLIQLLDSTPKEAAVTSTRPPIPGRAIPPKPMMALPPKLPPVTQTSQPKQEEDKTPVENTSRQQFKQEEDAPSTPTPMAQPESTTQTVAAAGPQTTQNAENREDMTAIEQPAVVEPEPTAAAAQEPVVIWEEKRERTSPMPSERSERSDKNQSQKVDELGRAHQSAPPPKYPVATPSQPGLGEEEKLLESSRMRKKKAQNELRAAIASFDPKKTQQKPLHPRSSGLVAQSFIYKPMPLDGSSQPVTRELSPSNLSSSSRPSESQTSERRKALSRYHSRSTYTPNKMAVEPFSASEIIQKHAKGLTSSRVTNSIATQPEELEAMKEAFKNKKKELEEARRALTKTELQLKGERQKVLALQGENDRLQDEVRQLRHADQEQLETLKTQQNASVRELRTKGAEMDALKDKLRRAVQQRQNFKRQGQEVANSFKKYKAEMDQTLQRLTAQREVKQPRAPSQSGVERLRNQAQLYEKQLDKQRAEIAKLRQQNSRLQRLRAEEDQEKSEQESEEEDAQSGHQHHHHHHMGLHQSQEQRNAESGNFSSGSGLQEYQHLEMPPSSSGSADHRGGVYPALVNEDTGELLNFEEGAGGGGVDEERGEDQQYMHLSESGGDFLSGHHSHHHHSHHHHSHHPMFFGWDQNEELKERENGAVHEEEDEAANQEEEELKQAPPPVHARSGSYTQSGSGGGKSDKRRERTGESGSTALIESNKRGGQAEEAKLELERDREEELKEEEEPEEGGGGGLSLPSQEERRSGIGETVQREANQLSSSGGNEQRGGGGGVGGMSMGMGMGMSGGGPAPEQDSSLALFQFLDEHVSPTNGVGVGVGMRGVVVTNEIPSQSSGEAAPASAKTHADNSDQIMRAPPSSIPFESSSRSPATMPSLDASYPLFQFQASDRDVLSSSGMLRDPAAPQPRPLNRNLGATGNCDENNESHEEDNPPPPVAAAALAPPQPAAAASPPASEVPANLFAPPPAASELADFFSDIQPQPQLGGGVGGQVEVFPGGDLFSSSNNRQAGSAGGAAAASGVEANPMAGLFGGGGAAGGSSSSSSNPFEDLWNRGV